MVARTVGFSGSAITVYRLRYCEMVLSDQISFEPFEQQE